MQEVKLPQLGQSVEEASIVTWYKQEGDRVEKGEPLCSIQTDKAEIDFESPAAGVLHRILLPADQLAPVMTVVALIGEPDETVPDLSAYTAGTAQNDDIPELHVLEDFESTAEPAEARARAIAERLGIDLAEVPASDPGGKVTPHDVARFAQMSGMTIPMAPEDAPSRMSETPGWIEGASETPGDELDKLLEDAFESEPDLVVDGAGAPRAGAQSALADASAALNDFLASSTSGTKLRISPVARKLAKLHGIDPARVKGSGPKGRIVKADILHAKESGAAAAKPAAKGAAAPPAAAPSGVTRVPLSPMRRIIATRMAESKFAAPHYYMTMEIDMARAKAFREKAPFRPSYNDIVMYATVKALQQHPSVNARWAGEAIEVVADINLGCAVALPQGLIVPVIRRAQTLSLQGLGEAARALAEKARTNKLLPDDYTGNTFTVSNLGAFGVDTFTAIINQPDSAILAVGQMKDQVVVIDGGIHIRPIMKVTLSSDHRVIDGAVAAQFMSTLKSTLEAGEF